MAKELRQIDINDVHGTQELLRIIEELQQNFESAVIQRDGQGVAILRPLKRAKTTTRTRRKTGVTTREDPLWRIIGMADRPEDPVNDVAENKHKYLAEAYADNHT